MRSSERRRWVFAVLLLCGAATRQAAVAQGVSDARLQQAPLRIL